MPSIATAEQGHPVIRWLMTEARRRSDPNDFLEAFAQQLRDAGVDVARITTGVPILHPQIFSFSGLWEIGKGVTERLFRSGPNISATMLNSPIRIAYEGGGPVRCDLEAPPSEGEFAILADLRRDGFTDYIVHTVPFADGSRRQLLLSADFVGAGKISAQSLGAFSLKGVGADQEIFAPTPSGSS